jgi:hypothetical protein
MTDTSWSGPDKDGIVTRNVDVGAVSTLRGRRKRKGTRIRIDQISLWPASWRDLLRDWLKQGGARKKWTNLLSVAGGGRVNDVWQMFDSLLRTGLIEVEEVREKGRWQPFWVEFLDFEATREAMGLPNREKTRNLQEVQAGTVFSNPFLETLRESLEKMPAERAVRRHEILLALDRWIEEDLGGTRRDFALFARGDTKGISAAEWSWLESSAALENFGVTRHTPALWLRAPLLLETASGGIDLNCVPDCIGLTLSTIDSLVSVEGRVGSWRILENRTVFERVSRDRGDVDGVVWVPGFAPSWWKKGMAGLLDLCPVPALIACDPDPAGIEIAMDAGQVWTSRNLAWEPWCMDAGTLSSLTVRKGLSEDDHARLDRLISRSLPEGLMKTVMWMREKGEKGEQEGICFN